MVRQSELAERFFDGAREGTASNVEIQERAGGTALVGYGWAVYAFRYPSGHVVYCHGWQGYSTSTNSQLGKMGFTDDGDPVDVPTAGYNYRAESWTELMPSDKFHVVDAEPIVGRGRSGNRPNLDEWLDAYDEPWL